jgi:apolipoprotein N-acyltransferase
MSGLARTGQFVQGLKGWRRALFTFAAGALSALGFAPFDAFLLLLFGFAALVLLLDGARASPRPVRAGAWTGFWFGFGQFLLGLHWIGFAFMVDPAAHAWQIPFVAVLLPGGLALFTACACAAAVALWQPGAGRLFLFAVCYSVAEWLRGHILTGFPWNIAAYGWGASLAILQSTALFGSYSLTLLTILFGASLADLFTAARKAWRAPAILTGLFALLWLGGEVRLAVTSPATISQVQLRLVQPNVPQDQKYLRRDVVRNWERLIDLSNEPGSPTIVIWPEAAPPFLLLPDTLPMDEIAALTEKGRVLMTGAIRRSRGTPDNIRYYNSFIVFGRGGRVLATYDKFHLVPFGEYLPLEKTLGRLGLTKLTGIGGSFAAGDGPHTVDVPGAPPADPLICYEILFPGEVVGPRRPGWIVNVTDDSWFGPWAGPRQHLLIARVRAIEEGLPVARAANTGISAIIDPLGRITASLGLNKMGIVNGALPAAIAATPYSRVGDWCFWLLVSANAALTWAFSKRK